MQALIEEHSCQMQEELARILKVTQQAFWHYLKSWEKEADEFYVEKQNKKDAKLKKRKGKRQNGIERGWNILIIPRTKSLSFML